MKIKRLGFGIGVVTTCVAALLVSMAGSGSAHVTAVSPDKPVKGGDAVITFRVPDEDDTAKTIKFTVTFPTATPVLSADTQPIAGWTPDVVTTKLDKPVKAGDLTVNEAVGSITWTAQDGVGVAPGQFQQFSIAVEGLPTDIDDLVMPATQTYDNGKVVNWSDQPPAPGAQEPEHPAPHLQLVNDTQTTANTATVPMVMTSQDDGARWLGGGALLVAGLALGFAVGALLRRRGPRRRTEFLDDEDALTSAGP